MNGLTIVGGFVIKKKVTLLLSLLFVLFISGCEGPADPDLKVKEIAFSDSWNKEKEDIGTPMTQFPSGTEIVYYRIKFEDPFLENFMIRKRWTRNTQDFLAAVCFMPIETIRICGEIHHHLPNMLLESGNYKISIDYFKDGEYHEVDYNDVNRTFTIE